MYIIEDAYTRYFLEWFDSFKEVMQWVSENSYAIGMCISKSNGDIIILIEHT